MTWEKQHTTGATGAGQPGTPKPATERASATESASGGDRPQDRAGGPAVVREQSGAVGAPVQQPGPATGDGTAGSAATRAAPDVPPVTPPPIAVPASVPGATAGGAAGNTPATPTNPGTAAGNPPATPTPVGAASPTPPTAPQPVAGRPPAAGPQPGGDSPPRDAWAAFGPAPEKVPGRVRRALTAVRRVLVHEYALAIVGALVLAVVMTWPTLRYPLHTIPQDIWDPTLQAWQMAWSGHILLTDPMQLWHSNAFHPERYSFAFSDSLLGYAPAGMIGAGPTAAVLRYNIVFVLAHALAVLGPYLLVRQLGAGRIGAAVAAAAFAYAPWRLAQEGHLHIVSAGGIPLALAMLARGHGWSLRHGYRPERRHAGWALGGWLVAAWQVSLGFGLGLPFGYVLAGIVVVGLLGWAVRRWALRAPRRPFGRRLLATDLVGGVVFAAVAVLLALPYYKVVQLHPYAQRSVEHLKLFSPPAKSFLIAPAESRVWGAAHAQARAALPWHPEMTLLPGFVLYALALGGLLYSIWTLRQRLLLLAGVLVSGALSMGTSLLGGRFTYLPLFEYLPGWNGIRTPGRLVLWTTLFLGLLAAGAVTEFARRAKDVAIERGPSRPTAWLRLATLVPLVLVLAEGLNVTPHPIVPLQPTAMRTVDGPLLVLPSEEPQDMNVMLWSTTRFQPIVNGGSGFTPQRQAAAREAARTFPDQASIDHLRSLGVRTVVLLRERLAGTPWETTADFPVDGLGITRQDVDNAIVFRL